MDEQIANMGQTSSTVIDLAVSYGPRVLVAALILLAGYYVGRWAGRALDRLLQKLDLDATVRILLTRIASTLVVLLFAIMALQNLGVELLPLIAGLGIAGAGIALALQGVLGNLAAGLTIIFTRPFKVGEYISIVGEEGLIEYVTVHHYLEPPGPLARHHSQPQDRRRDPAQLWHDPAAWPDGRHRL